MACSSFELKDGIETHDPLIRGEPDVRKTARKRQDKDRSGMLAVGGIALQSFVPFSGFEKAPNYVKRPSLMTKMGFDGESSSPEDTQMKVIIDRGDTSGVLYLSNAPLTDHEDETRHGDACPA